MLLSEYDFKSTFPSEGFLDVTETAENFNTKEFDEYVNNKNRNINSASQVCRINKIELQYLNEDMQDFKIDVNDISWLDGKIKNKWDLCAHGP